MTLQELFDQPQLLVEVLDVLEDQAPPADGDDPFGWDDD